MKKGDSPTSLILLRQGYGGQELRRTGMECPLQSLDPEALEGRPLQGVPLFHFQPSFRPRYEPWWEKRARLFLE